MLARRKFGADDGPALLRNCFINNCCQRITEPSTRSKAARFPQDHSAESRELRSPANRRSVIVTRSPCWITHRGRQSAPQLRRQLRWRLGRRSHTTADRRGIVHNPSAIHPGCAGQAGEADARSGAAPWAPLGAHLAAGASRCEARCQSSYLAPRLKDCMIIGSLPWARCCTS